jgi:hypothetical protein
VGLTFYVWSVNSLLTLKPEHQKMMKQKKVVVPVAWNPGKPARPGVMQAMLSPGFTSKVPPAAPPAFSVQQPARPLQAKLALPAACPKLPAVPPVYRPQAGAATLQPKLSIVKAPNVLAPRVPFGKKLIQRAELTRPSFNASASALKIEANDLGFDGHDLAHRMSWDEIKGELESATSQHDFDNLLRRVLIPARGFGTVKKGDTRLYNKGLEIMKKAKWKGCPEIANFLNSCPYNLRPGHPSDNRSIGGNRDVHRNEDQSSKQYPDGPPTPQSKQLFGGKIPNWERSSDMMTMSAFDDFEENFETFVQKALECGDRLLTKM